MTPPATAVVPAARSGRLDWLDLFRGVAVVLMIETHVLNTFLSPAVHAQPWFERVNFMNGLVAPSFLFIAGYLQGLSMRRSPGQVPARKWGRLLVLLGLGFFLQLGPLTSGITAETIRYATQLNILQCCAISLGILLLIQRWGGRAKDGLLILGLCGFVGAALALKGFHEAPVPILAFLNKTTGSFFPLFPWTGFVLAGALCTAWPAKWPAWLLPVSVIALTVILPDQTPFASENITFFIHRLAWVLSLAWIFERVSQSCYRPWLMLAGQKSLFFYVTHLIIITALSLNGMPALDLAASLLLYLGILITVLAMAACGPLLNFCWTWVKERLRSASVPPDALPVE